MAMLKDSALLLRLVCQGMQAAGIDADAVLAQVGADRSTLRDPELRIPHELQEEFWQAVETISGDPCAGLHIGEKMPLFRGQVIEYLFLSGATFGEGLRRALSYQRLLSDAANVRLRIEGDRACLEQLLWSRRLVHLNECMTMGMVRFFHAITEGQFVPLSIHLNHAPRASQADYQRAFGCPVEFERDCMRIYFPASLLALPSPHHEPELFRVHDQAALRKVASLEREDLIAEVNQVIAEKLESGEATLQQVADALQLAPRQLRGRLEEAGTSFNQLLSSYRARLARRLLAATDMSLDEVVALLGYAETSTFCRAFRRWTGTTPTAYREKKKQETAGKE